MKHIILLSAMCLMATAVSAEERSDTSGQFQQIDADQNGVISKAEASNSETLAPVFNQVDANQDGMLDTAEFAKFELIEKK